MKSYAATLAALFAASTEARVWFGECPSVEWNTGFDHAAFAGQWYEQERDAVFTFEMGQMCSTGNYVLNSDGLLDVQYRALIPMNFYQYGQSPQGVMDCTGGFDCKITMGESSDPVTWGILATDNDNWHVTWWCGEMMGVQYSWLGIYGKQPEISEEHLAQAKAAVEDKLPGYALGWPWMKKSVQGEFFGGQCEYEW